MNEQDERVRAYYENVSMPKDKVEMLLKIAEESGSDADSSVENQSNGLFGWWPRMPLNVWQQASFASALLLVISVWIYSSSAQSELATRTIREVAMNHTTRLEAEFHATSLEKLDNSMHQLPFNLVLPSMIDSAYELVGSRYCTLGGALAAHLKLQSKQSGKSMSLFVTSNSTALEEIEPQEQKLEGVAVEMWREEGLFFALAQRS